MYEEFNTLFCMHGVIGWFMGGVHCEGNLAWGWSSLIKVMSSVIANALLLSSSLFFHCGSLSLGHFQYEIRAERASQESKY